MPGWGRSDRPDPRRFDYSMYGLSAFLEKVLDELDVIWRHWDKGTQAAALALYRHADPDRLATAGCDLNKLTCPSLVIWGDRDIYLPTRFANAYAEALPNADLKLFEGAGHWPWLDAPKLVDDVLEFVA